MKIVFGQTEGDDEIVANTMKKLRLVNRHWCLWATRAIEILRPPNVPLRTLLTMVVEKFVNLRSLKLENVKKIGDEDLVNLGKLLSLMCLSFAPCKWHYSREITDMGVSALGSLGGLKELDLSYGDKITDAGVQHLETLTSLTKLSLGYCHMISDEGPRHLGSMIALRDLDLKSL